MTTTEEQTTTRVSDQTVEEIAAALGEVKPVPLAQIKRIIEILGLEKTRDLVTKTETIQAEGGLKTSDGSRARSKGGVFFYLVRGRLTPTDRRRVWPLGRNKGKKGNFQSLAWADRLPLLTKLRKRPPGEARTVKMTVIGRPARVIPKGEVVLISIPPSGKRPRLSKELPPPPDEALPTIVYTTLKQWKKVEAALKDPTDRLIVEGHPALDSRLKAMTIYATSLTTVTIQQGKRAG